MQCKNVARITVSNFALFSLFLFVVVVARFCFACYMSKFFLLNLIKQLEQDRGIM